MRGLHSPSFFWQWQAVYASSNPGHRKDSWEIDGVLWTKERHAYWGDQYSVQLEVHRMERKSASEVDWEILVVIERWWGPDREKYIRYSSWCKLIRGRAERVLAWLRKQDVQRVSPIGAADEGRNAFKKPLGQRRDA